MIIKLKITKKKRAVFKKFRKINKIFVKKTLKKNIKIKVKTQINLEENIIKAKPKITLILQRQLSSKRIFFRPRKKKDLTPKQKAHRKKKKKQRKKARNKARKKAKKKHSFLIRHQPLKKRIPKALFIKTLFINNNTNTKIICL